MPRTLGSTSALDWPTTPGAFQAAAGGLGDAVVFKLDPGATTLLYSTYLGGNNTDDGRGITVDGRGHAFVTGQTGSTNFPGVNSDSYQSALNGSRDAFVTELNATGTAAVFSTYLGGSAADDIGMGIAVDESGDVVVAGIAGIGDFPRVLPVWTAAGVTAFVSKLRQDGGALVFSSPLGDCAQIDGAGVALDRAGNAYVGGSSRSCFFPGSVLGPGGFIDAFVTKIDLSRPAAFTAIRSSQNPSQIGQPVTFTATVTANGPIFGIVEFREGPIRIGKGTVSNGEAAFTTTALTAGTHQITAAYLGDPTNAPSTSSQLEQRVVTVQATTTSLQATPNPAIVGQSVQLVATVTGQNPTGTVEFFEGGTSLGSGQLSGGIVTIAISTLPLGDHAIMAHYSGDTGNDPSDSSPLTVRITDPVDLAVAFVNPVQLAYVGQPLVYTVAVSNAGTVSGTGVTLLLSLPTGATVVAVTSTVGNCATTTSLRCDFGALSAGAQAAVAVTVMPTVSGSLMTTHGHTDRDRQPRRVCIDFGDSHCARRDATHTGDRGGPDVRIHRPRRSESDICTTVGG